MNRKTAIIIMSVIFIVSIIAGVWAYPRLPEVVAVHWDSQNNPNGYGSRFVAAFLMPIVLIAVAVIMFFVPLADPMKKNIALFKGNYHVFIVLVSFFLAYVNILSLLLNLGYEFELGNMMIPAMGVLFIFSGILLSKAQRNYMIGIKNAWTLSSDAVWNSTHKLGGWIFKACGVISFLGFFFPEQAVNFTLYPILASIVFLYAYSYWKYHRISNSAQRVLKDAGTLGVSEEDLVAAVVQQAERQKSEKDANLE
jgi:uncharacterized membrane protein